LKNSKENLCVLVSPWFVFLAPLASSWSGLLAELAGGGEQGKRKNEKNEKTA
jgi:hypothetical protein